jgi:hypothetical protein
MAILNALLQSTAEPITPLVDSDIAITVMLFCNNTIPDPFDDDAGRQFVDVYVVPDGGTVSSQNRIVYRIPIDAGDTFTFSTVRLVLSPGDRVYALATDSDIISSTISYVVI